MEKTIKYLYEIWVYKNNTVVTNKDDPKIFCAIMFFHKS